MEGQPGRELSSRVAVAANNLRVDAVTSEIAMAFAESEIPMVVLKGPVVARWLYEADSSRFYGDCDLLLSSSDLDVAASVLAKLGFEVRHDPAAPDWGREHATEFERDTDAAVVDLHTTLPGIGVDDATAWRELTRGTTTIVVAGTPVRALGLAALALHVALHSAHHGIEWKRPLQDLERAIETAGESIWAQAAALARRLDAVESLAAGLRLTELGRDLAASLELPRGRSVEIALRAGTAPPVALGIEQLHRDGFRAGLRFALQKLFPPPGFMRRWRPVANRGRVGMGLAYAYRPIWLLRRAPAGFRAWREARRAVSGR
jgi:hypothetical protein